jgi:hypothetical protein
MTELSALLVPILVSAVVSFFVSSIIHMATPWHKDDYRKLPDEDAYRAAVRPLAIPPGDYMVPRAMSMDEMKSPAFTAKTAEGPVAIMTVLPAGPFAMGKQLFLWFLFMIVVSLFAGYVAGMSLAPGATYGQVFRYVFTVAFAGYALALWPFTIWYRRALGTTIRSTIDGALYAALTAGVFGWLWPSA